MKATIQKIGDKTKEGLKFLKLDMHIIRYRRIVVKTHSTPIIAEQGNTGQKIPFCQITAEGVAMVFEIVCGIIPLS